MHAGEKEKSIGNKDYNLLPLLLVQILQLSRADNCH
jgi:hypothetical protein